MSDSDSSVEMEVVQKLYNRSCPESVPSVCFLIVFVLLDHLSNTGKCCMVYNSDLGQEIVSMSSSQVNTVVPL